MWTCGFMFFISVSLTVASELYGRNGWVPVNSKVVYNQIKRGQRGPHTTKFHDQYNSDGLNIDRTHRELKDLQSKQLITEVYYNQESHQPESYFLSLPLSTNQREKPDSVRRSKKLAAIDSEVLLNYILPKTDKPKDFLKKINEEKQNADITLTYKVTEDTEDESIEDDGVYIEDKRPEESKDHEGYEYARPITNNFTNELTKSLSKYNINSDDNIQNYILSRQPKVKSPVKHDRRYPLPLQAPTRYNSLNHLPVDSLLAVFLSNYGHYLQGQYGISNNYNNLYGYLASNNIHNNRPFGFYKLFSDTDSSNK